ncbi:hypothetical protein CRG98_006019 [Punica granatum]|uniref:Uncharacterized protein n=1 Tax=Punica granatum TaxID=22663 RepID=A0A2I0KYM3_PUNGR|nr:hypothetical protein CRG98_006019 [Punica granatum]
MGEVIGNGSELKKVIGTGPEERGEVIGNGSELKKVIGTGPEEVIGIGPEGKKNHRD